MSSCYNFTLTERTQALATSTQLTPCAHPCSAHSQCAAAAQPGVSFSYPPVGAERMAEGAVEARPIARQLLLQALLRVSPETLLLSAHSYPWEEQRAWCQRQLSWHQQSRIQHHSLLWHHELHLKINLNYIYVIYNSRGEVHHLEVGQLCMQSP